MDDVSVVIRDFNSQDDEPFIYSSWRNSSYYSSNSKAPGSASKYFTEKSKQIKDILEKAQVRIACLKDSPATMVGYCVYTGDHLNWLYVKTDYRKKGIGTLLMPKTIKSVDEKTTRVGEFLAHKKNLKTIGESKDGRNESTNQDPKETNPGLH